MASLDLGGALGGAASGAATGSAFGPIGTGLGTIAGGLLGAFGRKKKKKPKKISTFNPAQQALFSDYTNGVNGQGPLGGMFNFDANAARDNWNNMYAQPAYQQFQEEVIPGITGQFRGGNLQNSSYLAGALSKAGSDVQRNLNNNLANMLYQGQQDAVNRRVNAINNILNTQTFAYQQPQQNAGDKAFGALLNAGGDAFGNLINNRFNSTSQKSNPLSGNLIPGVSSFYNPPGARISTPGGG